MSTYHGYVLRTADGRYLRRILDLDEPQDGEYSEGISTTEDINRADVQKQRPGTADIRTLEDLLGDGKLLCMSVQVMRVVVPLPDQTFPTEALDGLRDLYPGEDVHIQREADTVTFTIGDRVATVTMEELLASDQNLVEFLALRFGSW